MSEQSKSHVSQIALFLVCFTLLTVTKVFAFDLDSGIEVNGQASVLVVPDHFVLSIAVVEKGHFTDKIRAIVDHKSDLVINIARKLDIPSNDINSARVSLRIIKKDSPIYLKGLEVNNQLPNNRQSQVHLGGNPREDNSRKTQYFELSRNITVKFSDIKKYDRFLNQVLKIGVGRVFPLTMSIDDTEKYYQQALKQAIANAKDKALLIANKIGQELANIISVKEQSSNHYRARFSSEMMTANSTYGHNSQVGNQSINANVLIRYALK